MEDEQEAFLLRLGAGDSRRSFSVPEVLGVMIEDGAGDDIGDTLREGLSIWMDGDEVGGMTMTSMGG